METVWRQLIFQMRPRDNLQPCLCWKKRLFHEKWGALLHDDNKKGNKGNFATLRKVSTYPRFAENTHCQHLLWSLCWENRAGFGTFNTEWYWGEKKKKKHLWNIWTHIRYIRSSFRSNLTSEIMFVPETVCTNFTCWTCPPKQKSAFFLEAVKNSVTVITSGGVSSRATELQKLKNSLLWMQVFLGSNWK